jgi:hypothetical protein
LSNLETVILWKDASVLFENDVLPYVIAAHEQDGVIAILAFPDKKFPVKVKCNPVISTFPSGITYAISESIWIPIPASSTRADLKRWMSWEQPGSQFDEAKVSGSRGNTYVVRRNKATGTLSCSCPGFKWRGKCKHLTKAFPT